MIGRDKHIAKFYDNGHNIVVTTRNQNVLKLLW